MTNGLVVLLGDVSHNLGAGMTGGKLFLYGEKSHFINADYIAPIELSLDDEIELKNILADYASETKSNSANRLLANWTAEKKHFRKYIPIGLAQRMKSVEIELH
jgi:glutamate synthase domain-containing protein 3